MTAHVAVMKITRGIEFVCAKHELVVLNWHPSHERAAVPHQHRIPFRCRTLQALWHCIAARLLVSNLCWTEACSSSQLPFQEIPRQLHRKPRQGQRESVHSVSKQTNTQTHPHIRPTTKENAHIDINEQRTQQTHDKHKQKKIEVAFPRIWC